MPLKHYRGVCQDREVKKAPEQISGWQLPKADWQEYQRLKWRVNVVVASASGVANLEFLLSLEVVQLMPISFPYHPSCGVEVREISSLLSFFKTVRKIIDNAGYCQKKKHVLDEPQPPFPPRNRRSFRDRSFSI
jgi:hypothetical protein